MTSASRRRTRVGGAVASDGSVHIVVLVQLLGTAASVRQQKAGTAILHDEAGGGWEQLGGQQGTGNTWHEQHSWSVEAPSL